MVRRKPPKSSRVAEPLNKGAVTRMKVVNAAIRVLARDGFAFTSFKAIADLAKVKQPTVFYYFPDKNDLVEGVVQEVVRRSHEWVKKGVNLQDDAFTRLTRHFKGNLVFFQTCREDAQVLLMMAYFASYEKRFAAIYAETLRVARERILEILYAGVREKLFHFKSEPEALAELLHDALLGGCLNLLSSEKARPVTIDADRKWRDFLVRETGYKS